MNNRKAQLLACTGGMFAFKGMDRREHTNQLLQACIGLLQAQDNELVVHVSSRPETPSDEDEASFFDASDIPPCSAEISKTPKSVNVNITINNVVLATKSPVTIGNSCGNRYNFAVEDLELVHQFKENLEALEDAAMKYIHIRCIILAFLHGFVRWMKMIDQYFDVLNALLKIIFICLFVLSFCRTDIFIAIIITFVGFYVKGMLNFRKLKATERRLSENLKVAVVQLNSTLVSLGRPGEITLQVVFGSEQILDVKDSLDTIGNKIRNTKDEEIGSLIKELEDIAKKLNCPSKEAVKVCISRVRKKLAA